MTGRLLIFAWIVALATILPLTSGDGRTAAQTKTPEQLEQLERALESSKENARKLDQEMERLADEIDALRDKMIATVARVQFQEADVIKSEDRLEKLQKDEVVITESLRVRREALVETVAALQVLEREPPPALLVHPDDAARAVRGALLLSQVVPLLKKEADELALQLTELKAVRAAIISQREQLDLDEQSLAKEQDKLEELLTQTQSIYDAVARQARREQRRIVEVGQQAEDLKRFLSELEARAQIYLPRPKPDPSEALVAALPQPRHKPIHNPNLGRVLSVSLPNTAALGEAFASARGNLPVPVNGRLVELFGEPLDSGGKSKGIKLETRQNAQVVAPFSGEVVAAGPYKEFGQILIIEVRDGYHLLLAGLERLYSQVGRQIAAGEPVGVMGDTSTRALWPVKGAAGGPLQSSASPVLYVEFRKLGEPFDPLPWFAATNQKVNG